MWNPLYDEERKRKIKTLSNNYNYRMNETVEFYGRSYQIHGRGKDQSRSSKSTHFANSHRCRRAIECRRRS